MTTSVETSGASAPGAARFVGQSVLRREDPRLLAGRGHYVDDVTLPGQLHVAFLRSDVAAGTIRAIDTADAEALPGVVAVLTAVHLPDDVPLWGTALGPPQSGPPIPVLAKTDVRFVGDPIAVVVATDRYVAEDAVDLIAADIESKPAVVTLEGAMADGAPVVHPELRTNVLASPRAPDPSFDEVLAQAEHVITRTFAMARTTNVPMEGRALVASYDPFSDEMRIWPSTQSPHEMKAFAARVLDVPEHRIRVEFGDVGGGFGQKMYVTREEAAVLLAAKKIGRPVKWVEDRRENLIAANQARHDIATVTMAVDAAGNFLAAAVDLVEGSGAYPVGGGAGNAATMLVPMMFPGPYRIPKLAFSSKTVFTNTCGKAPFRGPWAIETIAREQMVDAVARELGLDPLELRRRNVIRQADLPYTPPSGLPYDVVTPEETLDQATELLDWAGFRRAQAAAREIGRYLGVGLSICIEPSAVGMGVWATEAAAIRINPSGRVEVSMGSGSHGHSLETTIPQVVAEHLGCALDDVVLLQGGDTPYGPGTGGSRSAVILGGAAQTSATVLREKVVAIAAHLMEAAPTDLEVEGSVVSVRGTPTRKLSFAELAAAAYSNPGALPPGTEPGLEITRRFQPPAPFTWSNATHLCTCEVDIDTGSVRLHRFIVSEDCGIMINPMVVEGQIAGGVAQGIGGALYEEMAYDPEGNPLATTFLDYVIPTASEVPTIEYGHIETASNSLGGYKGMGEGGAIAAPAAVANAINDALAPLGATVTQFPISPGRILDALEAATGT